MTEYKTLDDGEHQILNSWSPRVVFETSYLWLHFQKYGVTGLLQIPSLAEEEIKSKKGD